MNRWIDVVWRWVVALAPWVLCLALPVAATPTLEQEIRTSFVTPHTQWAKPYAGGTTRVLFFSGERDA